MRAPAPLLALGVVFGDIGTSPLYALREAVEAGGGPRPEVVLGTASLILWSLILVVTIKYVVLILRADNHGEGGVLALAALLDLARRATRARRALLLVALVGAGALFGDAVLTPAISVLSAVEGVRVALPPLSGLEVPIAAAILLALFSVQRLGTHAVGGAFGPIMVVWFFTLGTLGLLAAIDNPAVWQAFDPRLGIALLSHTPGIALAVLAAVFLAVTGGEALYADLGQVGARAIRMAWYGLALPGLALAYLGQCALLLADPGAIDNPFYRLAPDVLQVPLLILATLATIIASQAVLTGLFSLCHQAMRLGFLPPLETTHTSGNDAHQVYVRSVNGLVGVLTIATVVGFGSSDALADAYGLAVALAMVTTTVLFVAWLARQIARPWAAAMGVGLLALDLVFLLPNGAKIAAGGWVPLALALGFVLVALAWQRGRSRIVKGRGEALGHLAQRIAPGGASTVDRPVVFLARPGILAPHALREVERLLQLRFAHVFVVTVWTRGRPRVPQAEAVHVIRLGPSITRFDVSVGYMQSVDLPSLLGPALKAEGVAADDVTYVVTLDRVLPPAHLRRPGDALALLFAALSRVALRAPDRYRLPPRRTLEIGSPVQA